MLKYLCQTDIDNFFSPPLSISIHNLKNIHITMDFNNNIILNFKGDNDTCERNIPTEFLEKSDEIFINTIFEDLFNINSNKMKNNINNIKISFIKDNFQSSEMKKILSNLYKSIIHVLSKTHDTNDIYIEEDDKYLCYIIKNKNKEKIISNVIKNEKKRNQESIGNEIITKKKKKNKRENEIDLIIEDILKNEGQEVVQNIIEKEEKNINKKKKNKNIKK